MPTVYLICGKLCCGKTTYAQKLKEKHNAVVLSIDEIMLPIFGLYAGEKHDDYVASVKQYLFAKSLELVRVGVNVILDWGFWTKAERDRAKALYKSENIPCELHYLDIKDEVWQTRIEKRNRAVMAGETTAYLVDAPLAAKFEARFEPPTPDEVDRWVNA